MVLVGPYLVYTIVLLGLNIHSCPWKCPSKWTTCGPINCSNCPLLLCCCSSTLRVWAISYFYESYIHSSGSCSYGENHIASLNVAIFSQIQKGEGMTTAIHIWGTKKLGAPLLRNRTGATIGLGAGKQQLVSMPCLSQSQQKITFKFSLYKFFAMFTLKILFDMYYLLFDFDILSSNVW